MSSDILYRILFVMLNAEVDSYVYDVWVTWEDEPFSQYVPSTSGTSFSSQLWKLLKSFHSMHENAMGCLSCHLPANVASTL
jgi:hypothetical protein